MLKWGESFRTRARCGAGIEMGTDADINSGVMQDNSVIYRAKETLGQRSFSFSISSGSKCSESKCRESRRISSSSVSCIVSPVCELDDGRDASSVAVVTVDVDAREDEDERMPAESMDFGREREGENRSSVVSTACGEAWNIA